MKIKIKDLTGTALDWAVATFQGLKIEYDGISHWVVSDKFVKQLGEHHDATGNQCGYSPSTDWAQGGPIFEREDMTVSGKNNGATEVRLRTGCQNKRGVYTFSTQRGPSLLTAAMRCYVANKAGDDVDVRGEL